MATSNNEEVCFERSKIISSTIKLVLKKNLSWEMLASMLDEMSSSISNSKQIISILLQEMRTLQENIQGSQNEEIAIGHQKNSSENEANETGLESNISHEDLKLDQSNNDESKDILEDNSEEMENVIEEKEASEELMKITILNNEDDYSCLNEDN